MLDDLKEKWPEILDFFKQEYDIADVSFKTWILRNTLIDTPA